MKISEILRKAANEYLWSGCGDYPEDDIYPSYYFDKTKPVEFCCDAIRRAWFNNSSSDIEFKQTIDFFTEYFKPAGSTNVWFKYHDYHSVQKRQNHRYTALLMAAEIAESEGK